MNMFLCHLLGLLTDDESGRSNVEESLGERVPLKTWLKKPEVLGSFQCNEVMATGDHYAG